MARHGRSFPIRPLILTVKQYGPPLVYNYLQGTLRAAGQSKSDAFLTKALQGATKAVGRDQLTPARTSLASQTATRGKAKAASTALLVGRSNAQGRDILATGTTRLSSLVTAKAKDAATVAVTKLLTADPVAAARVRLIPATTALASRTSSQAKDSASISLSKHLDGDTWSASRFRSSITLTKILNGRLGTAARSASAATLSKLLAGRLSSQAIASLSGVQSNRLIGLIATRGRDVALIAAIKYLNANDAARSRSLTPLLLEKHLDAQSKPTTQTRLATGLTNISARSQSRGATDADLLLSKLVRAYVLALSGAQGVCDVTAAEVNQLIGLIGTRGSDIALLRAVKHLEARAQSDSRTLSNTSVVKQLNGLAASDSRARFSSVIDLHLFGQSRGRSRGDALLTLTKYLDAEAYARSLVRGRPVLTYHLDAEGRSAIRARFTPGLTRLSARGLVAGLTESGLALDKMLSAKAGAGARTRFSYQIIAQLHAFCRGASTVRTLPNVDRVLRSNVGGRGASMGAAAITKRISALNYAQARTASQATSSHLLQGIASGRLKARATSFIWSSLGADIRELDALLLSSARLDAEILSIEVLDAMIVDDKEL